MSKNPTRKAEPKAAETTRVDQLNMKTKDADAAEGEKEPGSKAPKGKGRGRGRGQGRGRGCKDETKNKDAASASKSPAEAMVDSKLSARARKQNEKLDDDWAAWGSEDAWSYDWETWEEYQEWAWDSANHWDKECTKNELKELDQGKNQDQPAGSSAKSKRKAKDATEKTEKPAKKEKQEKQKKEKQEKKTDSEKQEIEKTKARSKRESKKRRTEDDDPETKSAAKSRKSTEKGEDAAKEDKTKKRKAGKAKEVKDPEEAEEEDGEEEGEHQVERSSVLPATKDERLQEMIKFAKGFKRMSEEDAKACMRGRLGIIHGCRLDVYYDRPGVGVTCRAEKKSFVYFTSKHGNVSKTMRLAAALKAGEMCVLCPKNMFKLKIVQSKECLSFSHWRHVVTIWCSLLLYSFQPCSILLRHALWMRWRSEKEWRRLTRSLKTLLSKTCADNWKNYFSTLWTSWKPSTGKSPEVFCGSNGGVVPA